jgi:hypothetical protein
MIARRFTAVALLALPALIAAVLLVYVPALHSSYVIDDYYNLYLLRDIGSGGYLEYIFSGVSGPLGRPLSMLSFALQHDSWPEGRAAFKAVNLGLHVGCGLLILLLARRIGTLLGWPRRDAIALGLGTTAFWLLNPMHVTTVLYTVQRMAQLSALFVLAGACLYLAGRAALADGRTRHGYTLMSAAVLLCTPLAVLSKENGVLLPLLLLIADATLFRAMPAGGFAWWRRVFLVLPSLLLVGYLLWRIPDLQPAYEQRAWSMWQKSITEAVVLCSYVLNMLLPRPSAFGLYHDDFPASAGLLDPPWTLAAVLLVGGAVAAGIRWRRRWPLLCLGLLWFAGAHLIESTILNLDLYFEHRNYTAAFGIALLPAAAAARLGRCSRWVVPVFCLYAVLLAAVAMQQSWLWRNPLLFAEVVARDHPRSARAQIDLGGVYLGTRQYPRALRHFEMLAQRFPDALHPRFKSIVIRACRLGERVDDGEWRALIEFAGRAAPSGFAIAAELDNTNRVIYAGECPAIDRTRLLQLIEVLVANPAFRREHGAILQMAVHLQLLDGARAAALANLYRAVAVSPTIERRALLVELLLAMRQPAAARRALDELRAALWRKPVTVLAKADDIRRYEAELQTLEAGAGS